MIYEYGDMWQMWGKTDLFLITGNASLNSKGEAVMGRGIALQAKERFPELPKLFGNQLLRLRNRARYGVLFNEIDGQRVGLFQVKHLFNEKADTNIIVESMGELIKGIAWNGLKRVDLNYPGIGNGKLPLEVVEPLMMALPDIVHIWRPQ